MTLSTTQKIAYSLVLIGLAIIVTIPDVVIGFLLEFFHLLFELAFIIFEWLESALDNVVEHLLNTELHATQTIVFYLIMAIFAYPFYYAWQKLKKLCFYLKNLLDNAQTQWAYFKADTNFYWQGLSLFGKIKVWVITLGAIYLASFLFM